MGFSKSTIDLIDGKFIASIYYYHWYTLFLREDKTEKTFLTRQEAKDWILNQRCYGNIDITDNASNQRSYSEITSKPIEINQVKKKKRKRKRKTPTSC
jgi:hypothetical protein